MKKYKFIFVFVFAILTLAGCSKENPLVIVEDVDGHKHVAFDVPNSFKVGDVIFIEKVKSNVKDVPYQWNFTGEKSEFGTSDPKALVNIKDGNNNDISIKMKTDFPPVIPEIKFGATYIKKVKIVDNVPYE